MQPPDLLAIFIEPLQTAGLRYMVSGSMASIHYGEPRFTLDVDLVLHLSADDVPRFTELFPEPDFYTPPPEVMAVEIGRPIRGHFNVIHLPTGMKADFYPSPKHPYWQWAWDHKRLREVNGLNICYAPPEYVILWKLQFFREGGGEKHLHDIRGMISVSAAQLDLALLERATRELGLHEVWQSLQSA